ncbi:MAG: hypothetical protein A3I11_04165 [Elusimicrobia bacterium RIFCSPLOWO2_02_FULL_39_32]|nr:MAG: hypothetical protein A2034_06505 [Elusimicrobia bacterium GWA2_38_7]OGR79569.1 MAG: hypothetical protein A3B80_02740 [Elusimicrobia bacterium RIFCSPHIGHO2_02_FULL_39_36]OGR92895.1 MAG: hypothetical protein A3I11_04165 [Elusimicrobia bacterium RIFCSPLOWO2_02_FULL_39_32]OGR99679.1 MAG: hypothetical protein A3G85_01530 [Elusimicrobia bacterium RIFCSPLOWO2_12_FULL_39_28]
MKNQKVSVLMPVLNGEKNLRNAIQSILTQTFNDFKFIIIDDGSTDKSQEVIASFHDPRIQLINNPKMLGLSASLNIGMKISRGYYIARMDVDDISLPTRLAKQVSFMDNHSEIGISGTWIKLLGEENNQIWKYHSNPQILKSELFFNNVFAHPSMIMRREWMLEKQLFYDPSLIKSQDYDLWVRSSQHFPMTNICEVLLEYRVSSEQLMRHLLDEQQKYPNLVRIKQLNDLRIYPSKDEVYLHQKICTNRIYKNNDLFYSQAKQWLNKIKKANREFLKYPEPFFSILIEKQLIKIKFAKIRQILENKLHPSNEF